MSDFVSRWLDYGRAPIKEPSKPRNLPANTVKSHTDRQDSTASLTALPLAVPRLPPQLERLVAAASSGLLPDVKLLESGLVRELNSYVLAWASSYLIGDPDEALRRLWQAYKAWR